MILDMLLLCTELGYRGGRNQNARLDDLLLLPQHARLNDGAVLLDPWALIVWCSFGDLQALVA